MCLTCLSILCALFNTFEWMLYYSSTIYFVYLSSFLYRDTIYLFYIYLFSYHCCSRHESTCLNDPSLIIFFSFPVEQKSDEVICISTAYDILSIMMHLPLEAPYRKITNERKREFLSTLGRMQALLVSYTAYNSVTTMHISAQMHMDIRLYSIVCNYSSDKHCLLSFNLK